MTEVAQTRMADAPEMPEIGSTIDNRYRVLGVLGEGGFAVVYKCYDERTHTEVAVKVLDPMMSRRAEFSARFLREVKTVAALRHHHTIKIHDSGTTDKGCLYLVMELLKGSDLDGIIEKGGAMDPGRVQRITIQVLKSLHEAHERGIIHRDLKPANVFIADIPGETDYVKVLDFGIAKSQEDEQNKGLTQTGQIMCSPDYVAPERVVDSLTVPASDLYSLGIMMIEMLEGTLPYKGDTPIVVALQHAKKDHPVPIQPNIEDGPLGPIVRKAVHKDYHARYQSAAEMLDDLVRVQLDGSGPYLTEMQSTLNRGGSATVMNPALTGRATELMSSVDMHGDDLPVEGAHSGRGMLWAAIAAVVAVSVVVVVILMNKNKTAEPAVLPPVAAVEEVPPSVDTPVVDETPDEVAEIVPEPAAADFRSQLGEYLELRSVPTGAEIYYRDSLIARSGERFHNSYVDELPWEVEFRAEGYETQRIVFADVEELKRAPIVTLKELPRTRTSGTSSSRPTDTTRGAAPSGSSSSGGSGTSSATATGGGSSSASGGSTGSSSAPSDEADGGRTGRINAIRVRQ